VFGNTDAVGALQTILNTIERRHNKTENLKRIIVNVGDYEKKREADLCAQAQKCADEAISLGRTIRMQPMNSYERHLIHDYLTNRKDVIAESFGVEPYRYLTIRPSEIDN
jgi:spoIIIJ-associated protein